MGNSYTLDFVFDMLERRGVLRGDQAADLRARSGAQRYKLERSAGLARGEDEVSPAELVGSFGVVMPDGGRLSEDRIMEMIAAEAGLRYYKVDPLKLDPKLITSTLPRAYARRHRMLPIKRHGTTLVLTTDNPFNLEALEQVQQRVGADIEVRVSSKSDILRHIREIYGFRRTLAAAERDLAAGHVDSGNLEQLVELTSMDEIESNDRHIVSAVDYLLHYALDHRASDIHIEPKREQAFVRLRVDGVLHTVRQLPKLVHNAVVNRVKTLARLDIAEKRRPQDGRIKLTRGDTEIELRVSTLSVAFGEKVVIRIFDPLVLLQDLDQLGFGADGLAMLRGFLARPYGLVLVTGPTGSGKTTTLYSALSALATNEVNVTTIEDPIEMVVEEFNQTAVHAKSGITFASALRTLLRQDPDVIMVGEIRDAETARQAIQAALTGHLVLSTLHTNDSASALTRLLELGCDAFLIASTVTGVIAQRLVRRVCENCRVESVLSREQIIALGEALDDDTPTPELRVYEGRGCVECRQTGLRGRIGVFEVLEVNERLRRHILAGSPAAEIAKTAIADGLKTLRVNAIAKLREGVTSFGEVLRATVDS
jgi:general secretion pathway protein E